MAFVERRHSRRVHYAAEARLEGLEAAPTQAQVTDICTDGAFLRCAANVAVGSIAALIFTLRGLEIRVTVSVRHAIPGVGIGVHFLNLQPHHRNLIAAIVDGRL